MYLAFAGRIIAILSLLDELWADWGPIPGAALAASMVETGGDVRRTGIRLVSIILTMHPFSYF